MTRAAAAAWLAGLAACAGPGAGHPRLLRETRVELGAPFEIQLVAADPAAARDALAAAWAEIERLDRVLSEWRETSEISAVNRRAGQGPLALGPEAYAVVERSIEFSRLTGGAFDLTWATCGGLWSVSARRIPSAAEVQACLPRIGWHKLRLDPAARTIELPDAEQRIGIGGIGVGYVVDRVARLLEEHGVTDYLIDAAGDVLLAGTKAGTPWRVAIADPRRHGEIWGALAPGQGAIATSGDYERYFERDGVRYHHIVDPATGRPADRTVAVTVVAPDAITADALSTGLFVLGPERGLELVESLPGVEALFFGPDLAVRRSSGFPAVDRPANGP